MRPFLERNTFENNISIVQVIVLNFILKRDFKTIKKLAKEYKSFKKRRKTITNSKLVYYPVSLENSKP